jgi:hypothetical protein
MVKKGLNCYITDSPPLLVIQQLVLEQGSFKKQFNHWKEIMDYSENGVLMFNGQNGFKYEMWSRRMKLFL